MLLLLLSVKTGLEWRKGSWQGWDIGCCEAPRHTGNLTRVLLKMETPSTSLNVPRAEHAAECEAGDNTRNCYLLF
jgi:hypothetical protein